MLHGFYSGLCPEIDLVVGPGNVGNIYHKYCRGAISLNVFRVEHIKCIKKQNKCGYLIGHKNA